MQLFDDVARADPSPSSGTEGNFTFLNRVATPFWAEIRALLEQWFSRYPATEAPKLWQAFRSKLPGQHFGAWWELYLHELWRCLGYEISLHPPLSDSPRTPDFELRRGTARLYVEASVVFSGLVADDDSANDAPAWMSDAINTIDNESFFIRIVGVEAEAQERLKVREIAQPLHQWLNGLDPDEVAAGYEGGSGFPQRTLCRRGWKVTFEAWPVKPEARGKSDHRVLGGGPVQCGWSNDIEQLHSKLKSKAGGYGRPEISLVTAVLCESPTMDGLDIEQALFGREAYRFNVNSSDEGQLVRQRNGFWMHDGGPQNQRVSAVVTAIGLHPWNVPRVAPQLWLNPWADHPLNEDWPFPRVTATQIGQVRYCNTEANMHALLGLPKDWPSGERFPRGER